MNRRMPNGTYGGVRGRGRKAPAYSIPASHRKIKKRIRPLSSSLRAFPLRTLRPLASEMSGREIKRFLSTSASFSSDLCGLEGAQRLGVR